MHPAIAIRFSYAITFSFYGVTLPFLPIIFHSLGLADSQMSLALVAMGLASAVTPVLLAHFADKQLQLRFLLALLLVGTACITPLWLLANSVWIAFGVTLLVFCTFIPCLSLLDAFSMAFIEKSAKDTGRIYHFKSFRIWGSLGFMVPTLLLLGIEQFRTIDHRVLIIFSALLAAISGLLALTLPADAKPKTVAPVPSLDAARQAARPPLRRFFVATAISGIGMSMFYAIFPRYLEELGCAPVQIGLFINFGVLCEVVLMAFGNRVIAFIGVERMLALAMLSVGVRMLALGLWPSLYTAAATQLLHAPIVLGLFVAAPGFLAANATDRVRYSLQGLYTSLVLGTTRLIGMLLLALIFSRTGGTDLDRLQFGAVIAGGFGVAGGCWMLFGRRGERGRNDSEL